MADQTDTNSNATSVEPLVHLVTDEEVKGQARELFEEISHTTGKVPKWMRVMANCDDVLVGFFSMFKAIMDNAPVDKLLKWRIALKISDLNKCEFCVSVAKSQLINFGLTEDEVNNIEKQPLSEKEQTAMDYSIASTQHAYNIDPGIISKMKKYYSDEEMVEISAVVGLFNFINRFNDSLGVLPNINDQPRSSRA